MPDLPKRDAKIRFQHREFKQRLNLARQYHRAPSINSQNSSTNFKFNRYWVIAGVLILLVGYLLFFPNFLTLKNIEINGLSPAQRSKALDLSKKFLKEHQAFGQGNFLLLSEKALTAYLLKSDLDIQSVASVKRIFPNSLVINVAHRGNCFYYPAQQQYYLVSCDGVITAATDTLASSTPFTLLKFSETPDLKVGQQIFASQVANLISNIQLSTLALPANTTLASIQIDGQPGSTVTLLTSTGAAILLDPGQNPKKIMDELNLILKDLTDQQKASLAYIDLRLNERGFVCIKNTACDKPLPPDTISTTTPSTTPDSIINPAN